MNVYVAYCHDRHVDPVIRVFRSADQAQKWAWDYMKTHVAHPDMLVDISDRHGYLIEYRLESDHAFVIRTSLT